MKKKLLLTIILGSVLIFQTGSSSMRGDLERLAERVWDRISVESRFLTHSQRTRIHQHLEKVLHIMDDDDFYNPRLFCSLTNRQGYLPTKGNGVQIGGEYGFSRREGCEEVLDSTKNNLICSWNGYTRLVYRISDAHPVIGSNDFKGGYSSTRGCTTAIEESSRDVVCLWNGTSDRGYLPYRISDGRALTRNENISEEGRGRFGFISQENCGKAIQRSRGYNICTWSGSKNIGYQLINIRAASVIVNFGPSSEDWEECLRNSSR